MSFKDSSNTWGWPPEDLKPLQASQKGKKDLTDRIRRKANPKMAIVNNSDNYQDNLSRSLNDYMNEQMQNMAQAAQVYQTTNPGEIRYLASNQLPPRTRLGVSNMTVKDFKVGDIVAPTREMIVAPQGISGDLLTLSINARAKVTKIGTKYVHIRLLDPNTLTSLSSYRHRYACLPEFLKVVKKAKALDPKIAFESVIMSDDHRQQIIDALKQVEHQSLIFDDWGFSETMEKGRAISFLFYGEPGTGKTLTAQAIADYLDKKLEIIGTGEIQSSEPGQAERNIKAYFEKSGPNKILLFDECDSLVHARNNTGSIMAAQINALLTGLEHYDGIAIFTTNRLGVLDEAFNRRLSLKLEFSMPTKEERLLIWKRMFPKKCPLDPKIQWDKLAEIELTGGYIKNIVLRAARAAAARGLKKITYEVLVQATKHEVHSKREFEKAAREHRKRGVVTINEAISDFNFEDNTENVLTRKEIMSHGPDTRKSPRTGETA